MVVKRSLFLHNIGIYVFDFHTHCEILLYQMNIERPLKIFLEATGQPKIFLEFHQGIKVRCTKVRPSRFVPRSTMSRDIIKRGTNRLVGFKTSTSQFVPHLTMSSEIVERGTSPSKRLQGKPLECLSAGTLYFVTRFNCLGMRYTYTT